MPTPCVTCGAPARRVDLAKDGNVVDFGFLCGSCLDAAWDELEILRGQFEALMAAGVDRKEANRIMIDRIGGTRELH